MNIKHALAVSFSYLHKSSRADKHQGLIVDWAKTVVDARSLGNSIMTKKNLQIPGKVFTASSATKLQNKQAEASFNFISTSIVSKMGIII